MVRRGNWSSRLFWIFVAIFTLAGLGYATWGERGMRDLFILKRHLRHIEERNQQIRVANRELTAEVDLLRKSERFIEKVAREELGMVKDGELIFVFPEP
ncbi:MAG: septum formation initiator family protein [Deltaproteobacteria bacterium]|nr:septum formation initiator family protein [Deltaproteobacteria bacterium]